MLGRFFCLFISFLLLETAFAQCPSHPNLKRFVDTAEIVDLLEMTKKMEACPLEKDSLGFLWHNLGLLAHGEDEVLLAMDYFVNAAANFNPKNPQRAYSLFNLGVFNLEGNPTLAYKHFYNAAEILNAAEKTEKYQKKLASTYIQMGNAKDYLADFDAIIEYGQVAKELATQYNDTATIVSALMIQGNAYTAIKNQQKIQEITQELDKLLRNYKSEREIKNSILVNAARVYSTLGDYQMALKNYKEVERDLPFIEDDGTCWNNLGHTYLKLKQYTLAKRYLLQVINGDFPTLKSHAHDNLAEVFFQEKQYQKAIHHYEQAILLAASLETPFNFDLLRKRLPKVQDKQGILIYIGDLAKRLVEIGDLQNDPSLLEKAANLYYLIDETIDLMREQHYDPNSKLFWRNEVHPFYQKAVGLCFSLGKMEDALYFSEKSKAILLFDRISKNIFQADLADSLQQKLLTLDAKINYLKGREKINTKQQIVLFGLEEKKVVLEKEIEKRYPAYYRLKNETLQVKTADILPLLKDKETVLMEFFYGEHVIYAFQISQDQPILGERINLDSILTNELQQFSHFFLDQGKQLINDKNKYDNLANSLYKKLFPNDLSQFSNLIIIPDGYLNNLPFDALLTKEAEANFKDLPYLGLEKTLSYGYSIPILQLQKVNKAQPEHQEVLAIFPEFTKQERDNAFLSYSQSELKGIAQSTRIKALNKQSANKQNLRNLAPQYQVIHFSSHATAGSPSKPPSIELLDSTLFLPELYAMKLNADLVVLSSCETGMGQFEIGEGVMSLARGFTYAGGNSLVSTLWQVNDASTSKIMVAFYQHLAQGQTKAEALHQAKLDYIKDSSTPSRYKSPYYWAGFIYVGNDTPLILSSPKNKIPYYILGSLLILSLLFLVKKVIPKT